MRARDDSGAARAERRGEPALRALRAPLPRRVRDRAHREGEGLGLGLGLGFALDPRPGSRQVNPNPNPNPDPNLHCVAAGALLGLLGLDAQLDRGEALLAQLRHLEPVRRDVRQRARRVPLYHRVVAAEKAVERLVRACSGARAGSRVARLGR